MAYKPGNVPLNTGKSKTYRWLVDHKDHQGDECLIWPFCRNRVYGYGHLQHNRAKLYAHRVMCELVNGPAPSDAHQAAHNCGKGHDGCVHPSHLVWKTVSDNLRDRSEHGTFKQGGKPRGVLTPKQIEAARLLKGRMPQNEIAEAFGVKRGTIQYWHRHEGDKVPLSETPTAVATRNRARRRWANDRS
jgi:hypothetical protein